MLRFLTALVMGLTLSGCWITEEELFSSKYFLIQHDLPQEVMIYYNDQQYLLSQIADLSEELNSPIYQGFGFDEIKLAGMGNNPNYVVVQGLRSDDQRYYYLLLGPGIINSETRPQPLMFSVNQWGDAMDGRYLEFELRYPDQDVLFEGNLSQLRQLEIRPLYRDSLQGNLFAISLDGLSEAERQEFVITDQEREQLLAERDAEAEREEQAYAEARFDRAIGERFLQNCNNAFAIASSLENAPISALISNFQREGGACVMDNGIVEMRLSVADVQNLQCNDTICTFTFSVSCSMETEFANDPMINRSVCGLVETARQPVTMRVSDDGRDVNVLSFEMARP